ncbi:2-halobenzoate 1,2-dioxygenase large subunit [Roseovarius albus]|uniref:2-halobenzoate 1,2-dioxygenase large subunit n=1 Tax=Roseovarius albus TaxID=1247867 RepID=A0A1X6ZQ30_9RHOB|nr:aromatic ring-hydroxylating dioxygenase subunit alpha [Roseovarius albus]SLN56219.1 2-halobenzoate 1,2-dioxygenase large subunit [Roseovarius albus]
MAQDDLQLMRDLVDNQPDGFALPRHFYTSQDVYEHDIKAYWNHSWIWVGHVSQIPNPGDYFLFDYAKESIIVVRDREGEVRAHMNVCRHRGSRVCTEKQGNARVFSCPYHAWTFDLSGKLRGGRAMGPDFDPSKYGLFPAQIRIFEGLIFVCASEDAPPIDAGLSELQTHAAPFDFANVKVAHEASYPVPANWKLALENYMECYHCAPSHKEYSRSHSLKDPAEMEGLLEPLQERSCAIGLKTEEVNQTGTDSAGPAADVYWRRYPLFEGYQTGSKDGQPLAPLLGTLTGFDGGATDMQIGPLNNFLIYADHVVGYRFVPTSLQETDIQIVWYVRGDAEEGIDYNKDDLTWLWHVTSLDDERIIRHNQEGVNSHRFEPGPLSDMEWGILTFYHSYLAMI